MISKLEQELESSKKENEKVQELKDKLEKLNNFNNGSLSQNTFTELNAGEKIRARI